MDLYEAIDSRRSVRKFLDKPIEPEKLSNILQAGMMAPSAGNLQAYKIFVVRTQAAKDALVPAADYQEFLSGAPALLVFIADLKRSESMYGQRGFELFAIQDATLAASYCQLAAAGEGLSSVWVGTFDPLEVSRVLSAMGYEVPVAILAIGYPGEEPAPRERRRPDELLREV